jgi:hypothetical protein
MTVMKEPTSRELAEKITAGIHEAVVLRMPEGASLTQIHAHLIASNLMVSRDTVVFWVRSLHDSGKLAYSVHHFWVLGPNASILRWDKPPPELPYEQWAAYQADSTPPGTYQPNMSPEWMGRWKAKMAGQRSKNLSELQVVIRKTAGGVQVKIIVFHSGEMSMSMNGTAQFYETEVAELPLVVDEARQAMRLYVRHHPVKETA